MSVSKIYLKNQDKFQNVYIILNPIIQISIFAGVWSIQKIDNIRFCTFSRYAAGVCLFTLILNIIHLLFIPYGIIYIEKYKLLSDSNNTTELSNEHFIIKMINPILVSSVGVLFRLLTLLKMNKYLPIILKLIDDVDILLEIDRKETQKNSLHIKLITVFTILISGPFQVYSIIRLSTLWMSLIMFFFNSYNNFCTICCEMQFIAICWIIYTRFKVIHKRIHFLTKTIKEKETITYSKENNKIIKLSISKQLENINLRKLNKNDQDLADKILIIKDAHHILCESSDLLNNMYDLQLLLSLSSCVINVLLNLYFTIFGGFKQPSTQDIIPQSLSSIINSLVWSLYYFIRFVCICTVAEYLTKEGNSTKILISNTMRRCVDCNTKEELWNFLNYAIVRKVEFTAWGFFKIDFSLIATAIATGTTYLVILAQFHKG